MLPDGTLINGFHRIQGVSNRNKQRGYNVEIIRFTGNGQSCSAPNHVNSLLVREVTDPDPAAACPDPAEAGGCPVRTGDIIPDFA